MSTIEVYITLPDHVIHLSQKHGTPKRSWSGRTTITRQLEIDQLSRFTHCQVCANVRQIRQALAQ